VRKKEEEEMVKKKKKKKLHLSSNFLPIFQGRTYSMPK